MRGTFDAAHLAAVFDEYGVQEWERHDRHPASRVAFILHVDLLAEFVQEGDLVFDAGAGPGRFTIELARLGATVHVGDLSPVQLELNNSMVAEAGCEGSVVARELLDICDLSHIPSGQFDVTVCFGGPLSYVRDRAPAALAELVRVTCPGGHVLISVMSRLGTMRAYLNSVMASRRAHGSEHVDQIVTAGRIDREAAGFGQEMFLYRWPDLEALCAPHGEIVAASATNFLTAGMDQAVANDLTGEEWQQVVDWERQLCRDPGVVGSGVHMLTAMRTHARSQGVSTGGDRQVLQLAWFGTSRMEHLEGFNAQMFNQADLPDVGSEVVVESWRNRGYVEQLRLSLQAAWPNLRFAVANHGEGGATSRDILRTIREVTEPEAYRVDVAFFGCGINDVWRRFQGRTAEAVDADEYDANYRASLRLLEAKARRVVCVSEMPFGWDAELDINLMNSEIEKYNALAASAAADAGADYIDAWSVFTQTTSKLGGWSQPNRRTDTLWSDGIHLSELGDALMLDLIRRHLADTDTVAQLTTEEILDRSAAQKASSTLVENLTDL